MNYSIRSIFIVVFLLSAAGCNMHVYQSDAIIKEAIKLDGEVVSFKAQKQSEVDKLNNTFRDTSERLFDQLTAIGNQELDLERDLNSQSIADQAVLDPNKVLLPSALHDSSVSFINQQFSQLDTVNQQITDARTQYANSAKTLQVSINQLTNIDTALQKLINGSNNADAQAILDFAQAAYDGANSGIAAAKTASTSAPKLQAE
jgi:hypothetical protein